MREKWSKMMSKLPYRVSGRGPAHAGRVPRHRAGRVVLRERNDIRCLGSRQHRHLPDPHQRVRKVERDAAGIVPAAAGRNGVGRHDNTAAKPPVVHPGPKLRGQLANPGVGSVVARQPRIEAVGIGRACAHGGQRSSDRASSYL